MYAIFSVKLYSVETRLSLRHPNATANEAQTLVWRNQQYIDMSPFAKDKLYWDRMDRSYRASTVDTEAFTINDPNAFKTLRVEIRKSSKRNDLRKLAYHSCAFCDETLLLFTYTSW